MSSNTPLWDNVVPQMDGAVPGGLPTNSTWESSSILEPRRSSLLSWTVRMAQAADRIALRAFPLNLWSGVGKARLAERTLNGLDRYCRLVPRHQEMVAAERARWRIEQSLEQRKSRLERFRRSYRAMRAAGRVIDEQFSGQVHLNPASCWIRIRDVSPSVANENRSSSVLYFLVDEEIRGVRMNLEGQVLINELADFQPCTIGQWARLSSLADARQLSGLAGHLAEIGLVACD